MRGVGGGGEREAWREAPIKEVKQRSGEAWSLAGIEDGGEDGGEDGAKVVDRDWVMRWMRWGKPGKSVFPPHNTMSIGIEWSSNDEMVAWMEKERMEGMPASESHNGSRNTERRSGSNTTLWPSGRT